MHHAIYYFLLYLFWYFLAVLSYILVLGNWNYQNTSNAEALRSALLKTKPHSIAILNKDFKHILNKFWIQQTFVYNQRKCYAIIGYTGWGYEMKSAGEYKPQWIASPNVNLERRIDKRHVQWKQNICFMIGSKQKKKKQLLTPKSNFARLVKDNAQKKQ